jgi:hypothetical protein
MFGFIGRANNERSKSYGIEKHYIKRPVSAFLFAMRTETICASVPLYASAAKKETSP